MSVSALAFSVDPRVDRPPLRFAVLGSGSSGNAVWIESNGSALLLDAGLSCRELERRMRSIGADPKRLEAVLLSHEHDDHVRGAARLAARHRLPVYGTRGTFEGWADAGRLSERLVRIASGQPFAIGNHWRVEPFLVPHDAREPVGFVIEDREGRRLGLAADLGYLSQLACGHLRKLDALLLEFNHDLDLLRTGPYPWPLKQRVAGRQGHLANHDAAWGLENLWSERLSVVVAYHLSRINNRPALVEACLAEVVERLGTRASLTVADQFQPTPWLEVTT